MRLIVKIYNSEREAGLSSLIKANNSIAYCVKAEKHEIPISDIASWTALASTIGISNLDPELFYVTKSVLTTTTWNKNDDVFGVLQTWAARKTPIHTLTDIEHDHDQIVGHIIDTWAVDASGNLIPDDTLESALPDKFHLCNSAVVYKFPRSTSEKAIARAEKLIEEIEAGTKYVSMECLFSNFNYAVISPENKFYVIARNEDTAFLTKHLRIYGGLGEYNGFKIGRFLENMVFSGKGYVDRPANPESIIFDNETEFNFLQSSLQDKWFDDKKNTILLESQETKVLIKGSENNSMDEELKQQLEALKAENAQLQKQLSEASVKEYQEKIADLETELNAANEKVKTLEETLAARQNEVSIASTKIDELTKANTELSDLIAKAEAEKVRIGRVSMLTEGGLDKEAAEKKVELFANLSDDQFAVLAQEILEAIAAKNSAGKPMDEEEENKEKKAQAEENAETDLDTATVTDESAVAGAVDSGEDANEAETLRLSIANYIGGNFSKPVKIQKGE